MVSVEIHNEMYNDRALKVGVPLSLQKYSVDFGEFLARMIVKLEKNSHKDTPTRATLNDMVALLRTEVEEFEDQVLLDKFDENAGMELADIANFAFLIFVALRGSNPNMEKLVARLDLPEFIEVYTGVNVKYSYRVETPPPPPPPLRYMYRRPLNGRMIEYGPYISIEAAAEYGQRAYMNQADREAEKDV